MIADICAPISDPLGYRMKLALGAIRCGQLPIRRSRRCSRSILIDPGTEIERIREAGMPQIFYVTAATAPKSASLRVFLPINDQQTVPLESTQTYLQGSKH